MLCVKSQKSERRKYPWAVIDDSGIIVAIFKDMEQANWFTQHFGYLHNPYQVNSNEAIVGAPVNRDKALDWARDYENWQNIEPRYLRYRERMKEHHNQHGNLKDYPDFDPFQEVDT